MDRRRRYAWCVATKILAIVLLAATVGRWLLGNRRRELSRWLQRFVDVSLVVIAGALAVQLILLAIRSAS